MGASVTLVTPNATTGYDQPVGTAASPLVTSASASSAGSTAAAPSYARSVGSASIATSQAATSISPAAATLLVAARAGRQSVVISNITGTQPVFIVATAATTGATTGFFIAGTAGASVTVSTSAAIYGTSPTAAQTVSILETF